VTRIALLLGVLGLSSCTAASDVRSADVACRLIRLAGVPIDSDAGLPFVRAEVDGAPVTLLVDSGAEHTLLTDAAVNRLHLPRDLQVATRTFGIGSPITSWDARLPNGISLGGARLPIVSVAVGRFEIEGGTGGTADGLLGADVMQTVDLDLDFPAGRATLYRARPQCPDAAPPWQEPFVTVSGTGGRHDHLLVPFELDGVKGTAVLDTGTEVSSITRALADKIAATEPDTAGDITIKVYGAAAEPMAMRVHRFHEFRVGPAVVNAPLLAVAPASEVMHDGLLGADFLRGRRVWLSLSMHRLLIAQLKTD
jgi:predicted aspartyl protease